MKIIIILVILLVLGFGIYFVSNVSTPTPSNQVNTEATTTVATTTATTSDQIINVNINIQNFSFSPKILTIKAGTKVTWTNNDSAPHTVTSDSNNLLNSPTLSTGQSFSFVFNTPGSTNYHCSVHPMMKGEIVVTK